MTYNIVLTAMEVLFFLGLVIHGYCQEFGYDGNDGPSFWGNKYHNCIGKYQSPIDIEENNVKIVKFPPLVFENFADQLQTVKLQNNGHTVLLSITQGKVPLVHGGPLKGKYEFSQLHFHWGKNDSEGSENLINNHSFPLELHMVFYKTEYGSLQAATNFSDGLTVLSFLYRATNEDNQNYIQFEKELNYVLNETEAIDIVDFVPLDSFTAIDRNAYFSYMGSLTTPPCSEVVTWIEFRNTIPLSHNQIQEFRFLSGSQGKLEHNFRPTQPLHDRIIYMNSMANPSTKLNLAVLLMGLIRFSYVFGSR